MAHEIFKIISTEYEYGARQLKLRIKSPREILVIALILISVSVILFSFVLQKRVVSSEDMKSYARNFVAAYNNDMNFFFTRQRKYFSFYSNLSYAAKAIISETHGVALLFNRSDAWSYQFEIVHERVERAIFGGNWSTFPMFRVPSGTVHSQIGGANGFFETSGHPFIEVQGNGSIILQYINVNSVYYHCVILKGSNETTFWTIEAAKEDAKDVFDSDLGTALSKSEEIRKRYGEPELTDLLQNMVINKLVNTTLEYSYLEIEEDIKFIERYAQHKYNITEPSDFVRNILALLEKKIALQEIPKKTIFGFPLEDPYNWKYVTACCVYPLSAFVLYRLAVYLVYKYRKLRDLKGWGKFVLGVLLTGGFSSLLKDRPYDYELVSIQTSVILIIVTLGTIAIIFLPEKIQKKKIKF